MDFQRLKHCVVATVAIIGVVWSSDSIAQLRTAPDIETPRNYQPGTGVDRNGIMSNPSRRRNTHYVVPGGGYYYGWFPGRYAFYDDYYYFDGNYVCPYCGSRWCSGRCRYYGPIYYPPIAGDAGAIFGPRAVRDFLGVDNNDAGGGGNLNPIIQAAAQAPIAPPKLSNPTARARAWKFVEYGDRQFKRGDYRQAAERYRKAQTQAPDVADVYFRIGFAEMGAGKYVEAVSAIRDGLALKPDWPNSGFVLEELYPTAESKREVFRQLHAYLEKNPNDADAQYLLAVLQHFDGQSEAAEVRFRRVVELTGVDTHARAFLPAE